MASPSSPSNLFKEILKMKRLNMRSAARRNSRRPRQTARWLYPSAVEREYQKYLKKIMALFTEQVNSYIRPRLQRWVEEQKSDSIRADEFNGEFPRMVDELETIEFEIFNPKGAGYHGYARPNVQSSITSFGTKTAEFNDKQWNKISNGILGESFVIMEPWLPGTVTQWGNLNFTLIKSLTDEYIKKVNLAVSDGVQAGNTWNKIWGDVQDLNTGLSDKRTRLIARDQIGKLHGQMSKHRMEDAGISMYEWLTSMDERVRDNHRPLNGKICQWDNGSVYADSVDDAVKGEWQSRSAIGAFEGMPGEDIQCRCTSAPVYADIIDDIDTEIKNENIS